MTNEELVKENMIAVTRRLDELGASLLPLLDVGFDPDAYFTPLEISLHHLFKSLGYDFRELHKIGYAEYCAEQQERSE